VTASALRPGEIVLRDATRSFSIRADNARTLKGALIGKRDPGPAPVPALQGVTLSIEPGETVGIVGRNGAGKTSTLKALAGIVPLQSGEAICGGRVVSLLELAAGFSRDFSGRENVYLQGALYGLTKAEMAARIDEIIAFSELAGFIEVPIKTYSQGMLLRLGFSIAAHLDADVMLIDEVLAVGDEAFQRKCLQRISEQIDAGATLVLVSHDPTSIERVCSRVVVLEHGRVEFDGPTAEGLLHYHRLMGTEHGSTETLRPALADAALQVVELELRDGAGRSSHVFHAGAPLHVLASVKAVREAHAPALVLELSDQSGTLLHRTRMELELEGGATAQVSFEIPELPLLGGDYDLTLEAGDGVVAVLAADRTVRFSVAREPGAEGLIDIRGSWRTPAHVGGVK
jgi:ABC-type polysaccharide/polyol phosphate transport system ATPase subunit